MNTTIFTLIMLLFTASYIYVIIINARAANCRDEYFLCGKQLKTAFLTFTFIATQVGGGMVVGIADAAYNQGLAALFYPMGNLVGLIIVALFLAKKYKTENLSTVSELFEKKYNMPSLRVFASIINSLSLFIILVAQGIAIKKLLAALGIDSYLIVSLLWISVVAYTSLGGLRAVVQTDVLQMLFIAFALFVLLFIVMRDFTITPDMIFTTHNLQFKNLVDWFIWPCCYMLIEQDMAQRFFAADSDKSLRKAAILAAIVIFVLALIPTLVGILAKFQGIEISLQKGALLSFSQLFLNPTLYAIIIATILLAILSTVDSLLCATSSNIAYDFKLPSISFSRQYISLDSILTMIVGCSALAIIYFYNDIFYVLMFSYGLCVSTLFVPFVFGFLLKNPGKLSAIFSMIAGLVFFICTVKSEYNIAWASILIATMAYFLGYFLTNKRIKSVINVFLR